MQLQKAFFDYLAASSLDQERLVGGACDVMVGLLTGVVAHIKVKIPTFLATHCVAHRLSLAAVDACSGSPIVSQFRTIINEIYSFFSQSTVHTSQLREIKKAINDPLLKMTRATETRWLSHQMAVDVLRRSIKAVKLVMEQEAAAGNATALGLSTETHIHCCNACPFRCSVHSWKSFSLSKSLNLLSVEDLVRDCKSALGELKEFPLQGSYAS